MTHCLRDEGLPVSHAHVHGMIDQLGEGLCLKIGEPQQRRPAPNEAVAVGNFLHDGVWQRPAAPHIQQELRDILEFVGRPMGQQQYSPT